MLGTPQEAKAAERIYPRVASGFLEIESWSRLNWAGLLVDPVDPAET